MDKMYLHGMEHYHVPGKTENGKKCTCVEWGGKKPVKKYIPYIVRRWQRDHAFQSITSISVGELHEKKQLPSWQFPLLFKNHARIFQNTPGKYFPECTRRLVIIISLLYLKLLVLPII